MSEDFVLLNTNNILQEIRYDQLNRIYLKKALAYWVFFCKMQHLQDFILKDFRAATIIQREWKKYRIAKYARITKYMQNPTDPYPFFCFPFLRFQGVAGSGKSRLPAFQFQCQTQKSRCDVQTSTLCVD